MEVVDESLAEGPPQTARSSWIPSEEIGKKNAKNPKPKRAGAKRKEGGMFGKMNSDKEKGLTFTTYSHIHHIHHISTYSPHIHIFTYSPHSPPET
jgi:hypothetical protein